MVHSVIGKVEVVRRDINFENPWARRLWWLSEKWCYCFWCKVVSCMLNKMNAIIMYCKINIFYCPLLKLWIVKVKSEHKQQSCKGFKALKKLNIWFNGWKKQQSIRNIWSKILLKFEIRLTFTSYTCRQIGKKSLGAYLFEIIKTNKVLSFTR